MFQALVLRFLNRFSNSSSETIEFNQEFFPKSIDNIGDIKTMEGYNDGRKRLRVGSWRIIYRYENEETVEIIFVIDIGNRGDI